MQNALRPVALVAVIGVVIFSVYLVMQPGSESTIGEGAPVTVRAQVYESAAYGIRFSYPESYVLTERDSGSGERMHHTVVLMDKTAAANIPVGGEGPTAITIDVFGNNIDKLPLESWIQNSSASNFKLSPDGTLTKTVVGGAEGLSYTWDGLYRGESTVVEHREMIFMFSGTYMDTTDTIRADYRGVLESVELL